MIDLPKLAEHITKLGIMSKPFYECTQEEIEGLCQAVMNSFDDTVPPTGWVSPCIVAGELVISVNSHPKYHWWKPKGQPIADTLLELAAPFEVAKKYIAAGMGTPLTEGEWLNKLVPF